MRGRPQSGLTLVELIVVIVILAMLLGLSVALFRNSNRDLGVRATAGALVSQLRALREHARSEGAPAWMVLDLNDPQSFFVLTGQTVGLWHFESNTGGSTPGAFDKNGTTTRVSEVAGGRVGGAFYFTPRSSVDCGEIPVYSEDQGVSVDFWINRISLDGRPMPTGAQTICTIGNEFEIRLSSTGYLQAKIGGLKVSAPQDMVLPEESWAYVSFIYNGLEAQLYINKVLVGTASGKADWTKNSPLLVGDEKKGFLGMIDEFRISLILPLERHLLPREVQFEFQTGVLSSNQKEVRIHFDPEGRLDSRYHQQPVQFKLVSPTDEHEIMIPLTGIVSRKADASGNYAPGSRPPAPSGRTPTPGSGKD